MIKNKLLKKRHNKIKARIKNGHTKPSDLIELEKLKRALGYK